ncbi:hypothetical protein O7626_39700 [Micromonospora sp. WMMD1102]|uniref:hypothetical protein n=1 Tax=Micromonospora sp. WMMD1102 TaxID=3016105 RepID=UPI0024155DDB|nr:hypothetical protein [Micromonospora sp. WMMD1102]MDG4791940.1 hypothetical protein [Micromonospora sp. WMMD1102]
MADPDGMHCELITDEAGKVIARARVSADIGEEGRAALRELIAAACRLDDERLAADPERAELRRRSAERIAERNRRWRGEDRG